MDLDPETGQLLRDSVAELVVAQGGEQLARSGQLRQLHGSHGAATRRRIPRLGGVDDLAGGGHPFDLGELHPLHVSDNGHAQRTPGAHG
jgi:hypothetical protein